MYYKLFSFVADRREPEGGSAELGDHVPPFHASSHPPDLHPRLRRQVRGHQWTGKSLLLIIGEI